VKSIFITVGQLIFSLAMYLIATLYFGLALIPGIAIFLKAWEAGLALPMVMRYALLGFSLAGGYFIFGFSMIILAGLTRTALRLRLEEGNYPIFSRMALKWAFVSSLYLFINFTFVDFILLTPFANLLQRLLGAKLGKNVQINSKFVFDATLLEIGDNTVVGGGAIIIGHVVERGILKLKKVKIGNNVTIGSHATIMPGCQIGDNAIIGASAVLLKNTKVEDRAIYFGVPAEQIKPHHKEAANA
jgi:acetyltransferase-like isoleucine patch superfamily enzyme